MATHSSILAWKIPWTEELGGLQSVGSQKDRHDLATKLQRKGMFYLEWCSIKDVVVIHSFFHQRVIELLYAPRIKTTKMSETQPCPEAVSFPSREMLAEADTSFFRSNDDSKGSRQ